MALPMQGVRVLGSTASWRQEKPLPYPHCMLRPASVAGGFGGLEIQVGRKPAILAL